jgi:hypothetical protein
MNTTDTATGTYQGKTAAEWRAEAAAAYKAREASWDRSDTDGCLSQWASGLTGQENGLRAQLAEQNGLTQVCAVFDLDGNLVPTVHGWGEYGEYFAILDNEERGCRRFFSPSKAKKEETARRNNAAKGFYIGLVKVPGKTKICGGGTGLAGAASCYAAIVPANRTDKGTQMVTAEHVVEVINNGQ